MTALKNRLLLAPAVALFAIGALAACDSDDDTKVADSPSSSQSSQDGESPAGEPAPEAEATDDLTTGQKNALKSAESYLDLMAFSHSGLVKQLEFEGYSAEDATFAADTVTVDWNEQAAKSAKSYMDLMSFSRDGLIEQLTFEGFTAEQAEFGVSQAGY